MLDTLQSTHQASGLWCDFVMPVLKILTLFIACFLLVPFSGTADAVLMSADSQTVTKVLLKFHPKTMSRKQSLKLWVAKGDMKVVQRRLDLSAASEGWKCCRIIVRLTYSV